MFACMQNTSCMQVSRALSNLRQMCTPRAVMQCMPWATFTSAKHHVPLAPSVCHDNVNSIDVERGVPPPSTPSTGSSCGRNRAR